MPPREKPRVRCGRDEPPDMPKMTAMPACAAIAARKSTTHVMKRDRRGRRLPGESGPAISDAEHSQRAVGASRSAHLQQNAVFCAINRIYNTIFY
eukprot:scaffold35724_cov146-Isochrysis_galbana.AAC.1